MIILFFILSIVSKTASSDMVVIVAASTPVDHANKSLISDIFLDRIHTFDNGTPVIPVNNNALMKYFYLRVADRNQNEMESYWSKLLFTSRGEPPMSLDDDKLVIDLITNNPSMVGYVNADSVKNNPNLKVIETITDDVYAVGSN